MSKKIKVKKDGEPELELSVPGEIDLAGVTIRLSTAESGRIHVDFPERVRHSSGGSRGAMHLTLTSPTGQTVRLMGDLEDKPGPGSK